MKKLLRVVNLVIGWFFMWMSIEAMIEGILFIDSRILILVSVAAFLPLGLVFVYMGKDYSSNRTRFIKSIEVFFIIVFINAIIKMTTILFPIGFVLLILSGIALFLLGKTKLEGEFDS